MKENIILIALLFCILSFGMVIGKSIAKIEYNNELIEKTGDKICPAALYTLA